MLSVSNLYQTTTCFFVPKHFLYIAFLKPGMIDRTKITYESIRQAWDKNGFAFFDRGNLNLNIFGVRNASHQVDQFDDLLGIAFRRNNNPEVRLYPATTHPGLTELVNPSFPNAQKNGTAILAPGQYRSAYRLGFHGTGTWRHEALVQQRPVRIYRDKNRDTLIDFVPKTLEAGLYGINIHGSSLWGVAQNVGRASAGCQVFQSGADLREFIGICKEAAAQWGPVFTYTLVNETDFFAQ
jgi:hypothetical protein